MCWRAASFVIPLDFDGHSLVQGGLDAIALQKVKQRLAVCDNCSVHSQALLRLVDRELGLHAHPEEHLDQQRLF